MLCYLISLLAVTLVIFFVVAPRVAVVREEGINGDREMAASLYLAGFEVWDVTMQDLMNRKVNADYFRGIIFPGGFSYAGKMRTF